MLQLLKIILEKLESFYAHEPKGQYTLDYEGFIEWNINHAGYQRAVKHNPHWDGKEKGRSMESIICTLLNQLNKYAKTYSKSAMSDSDFSTQDEFIYLINLKEKGPMSKMELIKMNIHDKSIGMKIISRLIEQNWIIQTESNNDKRKKIIKISRQGLEDLKTIMPKIKLASRIVTGNLSHSDKCTLIDALNKLDKFHKPIFQQNIASSDLLKAVTQNYL